MEEYRGRDLSAKELQLARLVGPVSLWRANGKFDKEMFFRLYPSISALE